MTEVIVGVCGIALTAAIAAVTGGFGLTRWILGQLDRRFEKVDQQFDKVDQRFEKVDQRFDKIDERFVKVDQRFAQSAVHVDWRLTEQGIVLGTAIGALAMEVDRGFRAVDARMDRMEGRMDRMAGEIAGLRTDLSEHLAHHAA